MESFEIQILETKFIMGVIKVGNMFQFALMSSNKPEIKPMVRVFKNQQNAISLFFDTVEQYKEKKIKAERMKKKILVSGDQRDLPHNLEDSH